MISFLKSLSFTLALSVVASCNGPVRPSKDQLSVDVANAIAVCSSGIEIEDSVSAELSSNLASILEDEASVNARAEIASRIRGIVFTPEVLSDPEGQASYEVYTNCVTGQLGRYLPEEA